MLSFADWRPAGRPLLGAVLAAACVLSACHQVASQTGDQKAKAAQQPSLSIASSGTDRRLTTSALLSRPDRTTIVVPADVSYHRSFSASAVPLANLLPASDAKGTLEVRSLDGFTAEIPLSQIASRQQSATAYLAIEDPSRPWPHLPGKPASAGPFYVIWSGRDAAKISSEFWPYQIARLSVKQDPIDRWPALALAGGADDGSAFRGQRLFVANCLSCHKIDGEGEGRVGPDLDRPANPTDYFQRAALHRYIRSPTSLRHWPGQVMPGFDRSHLSDADIDDIIAYLAAIGSRRSETALPGKAR